jgi:hypothetical protein
MGNSSAMTAQAGRGGARAERRRGVRETRRSVGLSVNVAPGAGLRSSKATRRIVVERREAQKSSGQGLLPPGESFPSASWVSAAEGEETGGIETNCQRSPPSGW